MSEDRRTETTDTYVIVRARLANGLRIGDGDIVQLCDEIERLRARMAELEEDAEDNHDRALERKEQMDRMA